MGKLSTPLRTGIGPSFPWLLPQVQAARNHLLNACAALNQWRRTFSLEVLPFVEECEPVRAVNAPTRCSRSCSTLPRSSPLRPFPGA